MFQDKIREDAIYQIQQNYLKNVRKKRSQHNIERFIIAERSGSRILFQYKSQSFHNSQPPKTLFEQYIEQRRQKRESQQHISDQQNQSLSSSMKQFQLRRILIGKPTLNQPKFEMPQSKILLSQKPSINTIANKKKSIYRKESSQIHQNLQMRTMRPVLKEERDSISRIKINGWQIENEDDSLL